MKKQQFPPGWDAARVQRVIDHYENMTDDEWIAEDEAAEKANKNQLPVPWAHKTNGVADPKKSKPRTSQLAVPTVSPTSNGAQRQKKDRRPKARPLAKGKAKHAKSDRGRVGTK